MRRPPYHKENGGRLEVKMTPMIDVIFLLLIFFVCTASFSAPEEVLPTHLLLPGTVDSDMPIPPELEDLEELIIEVSRREGRPLWKVGGSDYGKLLQLHAVLRAVHDLQADLPVILDVAPNVPMENVIDVFDLCREVGFEKIQFAASEQP
jgi:biopolymer transport protein ExbD